MCTVKGEVDAYKTCANSDTCISCTSSAVVFNSDCRCRRCCDQDFATMSGRAVFQFYCSTHAFVNFQAEMKPYFRQYNDDSFWVWMDDGLATGTVQLLTGPTSTTEWRHLLVWGGTGMRVGPGQHNITFAEREDGTMLKSLAMTAGYPQCQFGGPLPGANISILTVIENFEEANRVAEQRVNYQLSALQNLTTQLVANLSMNMQNESQRLTDIALDYSRQIDSVMGNISTAMNATATGLQTQISGLSSRVSGVLGAIAAVVAPGTSTGTTADTQGSVAKTGNDVVISAPGAVKVSGSTCSDVDVCALRASLQNIISAAAAAATGPSPP
eukprot:m.425031 g.425031  ORF g.425031 m.425031 type:complete len:328 (-) comp21342_c2_seq17:323-1306(-)